MRRAVPRPIRIWLAVSLAGFAAPALAYLDPSTGSMILSAVVGIFATVSLALKTYWYKLKALFRRPPPATGASSGQPDERRAPQGGPQ